MNQPKQERFKTSVGGQALMEGIMMRGPEKICCAVRKPDGTIETKIEPTPKHGIWTKIPLVRGAISMVESLIMGYRYMMYSAQVSMGDDYDPEEEETAFEKWVGDHLGKKAEDVLLGAAAVGWHREGVWQQQGQLLLCRQHRFHLHQLCVFHPDTGFTALQSPWAVTVQRANLTLVFPGKEKVTVRSVPLAALDFLEI